MPVLPRYQKTGIKVRQPSGMDFADAREAARMGETLSAELDRMSDFAFREGEKLAVRRGQERVRQEGAVPVLTALQQKEGPRTIAEQAAFDAANRIAVVEIETAARSDMRKLVTEADETNMEISVFNQKMSDIQDGYAASMQVVDPVAAGVLNARLQEDNVAYSTKYSEIVTTKAKAAYAENTQTILTEGAQTIFDLSLTEGENEETIRKQGEKLLQTALDRGVGDKKAQKLVDDTVNAAIRENLVYRYENAEGILEKQAIVNELSEIEKYPGMNYEQTRNFEEKFRNELNSEINTGRTKFTNELDDAITFLVNTGKIKPGFEVDEDKLTALFLDDQETLDALLRQWENTQEDVKTYGSLSSMPTEKANELAQQLIEEANNPPEGATGAEAKLLRDRATNFQKALIQRQQSLREDSALYVTQTNKQAEQLTSTFFKALGEGNIGLAATVLSGLNETLNIQYDVIGVPQNDRRLLSKDMAQQMIQTIQAIDDDVEIAIIKEIQNGLGDLAPRFVSELRKNGLAPEYVEALFTDDLSLQKQLVQLSQSKEADLKPKGERIASDAEAILLQGVNDYRLAFLRGGDSESIEDYNQQYDVAKKLMYKYMTVDGLNGEAAATRVIKEIFPEFDNIVNTDSGRFIVPKQFSAQDMETLSGGLLRTRILQEMGIQGLQVDDYPGDISEAVSLAALASKGEWLNNSTGDGIVLHYRTASGRLLPVRFDNNQLVDIKFKDLPKVYTTIRQQIKEGLPVIDDASEVSDDNILNLPVRPRREDFDSITLKKRREDRNFNQAMEAYDRSIMDLMPPAIDEEANNSDLDADPMKYMQTVPRDANLKKRKDYTFYVSEKLEKSEEPLSYAEWLKTQ